MNENTLISVQCYAGDVHRVEMLLPWHEAHQAPIVVLSSQDQPVKSLGSHICRSAGQSGYIGQHTLDRQLAQIQILLEYPFDWYFLNDSDSFCLSSRLPVQLYENPNVVWSNEVLEPRPHLSPYPKIAMQAPYFLSRSALEKIVKTGPNFPAHPITPYIDWAMLAWTCESGLLHWPFRYADNMMHPIKTPQDLEFVVKNPRIL